MTSVNTILDYYLWEKKIKNPKTYIRRKLLKLNKLKLFQNKSKNCTVFLTNNKTMKELNKKFRKKNKSTDELLGCYDEKNGKRYKVKGYLEEFALMKNEAEDLIVNARNIIFK